MNSNLLFLIPLLLVIGLLFLIHLQNKLISLASHLLLILALLAGLIVMPIGQTYSKELAILESAFKNSIYKCEKCDIGDDTCEPCKYQASLQKNSQLIYMVPHSPCFLTNIQVKNIIWKEKNIKK